MYVSKLQIQDYAEGNIFSFVVLFSWLSSVSSVLDPCHSFALITGTRLFNGATTEHNHLKLALTTICH